MRAQGVATPVSNPPFTIRFCWFWEEVTVRLMVVVCVRVPDVPVTVTVVVPVVAVAPAAKVSTLVEVVGFVPNVAVTPEGKPDADKLTLPVKPPEGLTVIVLFPLLP